jgi:uncharacterized repeat protein (TIGR01451 family)
MNVSFLKQFVLTFIFCILYFYATNISLADPNIDLSINKVSSKTSVSPNDTVSYTVTFENKGSVDIPSSKASIKDFTDKNNLDISSASFIGLSSGDYCSVTQDPDPLVAIFQGQYINCSLGSLPAGAKRSLTYTLKVKDNASIGTEILNIAYISVPDEEGVNKGNNSSQANVKVVASQANTTTTNTEDSTTNTTSNDTSSSDVSTNNDVEDTENISKSTNNTTNNTTNNNNEDPVDSTEDYSTAPSEASTNNTNSNNTDSSESNTQTTETTLANTITDVYNVDLSILKSVNKTTAKIGDNVTYTIQYTNKGSHTAKNVKIQDFLDKESLDVTKTSFSSSSCSITVDSDPLVAIFQGEFMLCNIGDLKANETKTLTYTLPVSSNVVSGKIIKNLASISTSSEDSNKSNNSSSVSFVVGGTSVDNTDPFQANPDNTINTENDDTQEDTTDTGNTNTAPAVEIDYKGPFAEGVDLSIEKSTTTPKVKPTKKAFYKIKYINKGKLNATNVSIKDLIDLDKFDYTKIEFIEKPSGVNCSISGDEDPLVEVFEGKVILCKLGIVKSGEIRTISYSIPLKSDVIVGEKITNKAIIKTTSTDLKSGNNSSTAYITVEDPSESNITVTKKSEKDEYKKGDSVKYTINVKNTGNVKAKNISLKDLSSGDRFKMEDIEYSGINSLFCKVKDYPDLLLAVFQGSHIECSISEIDPNDSFEFSYTLPLKDDVEVGETISNTVVVSSENETGSNADNKSVEIIKIVQPVTSVQNFTSNTTNTTTTTSTRTETDTISNVSSSGTSTNSQSFHGSASDSGTGGGCKLYSTIDLDIQAFVKDKTGNFVDADSLGSAVEVANKSKISYKVEIGNKGTVSASKLKVLLNFGDLDSSKYNITNIKNAELKGNTFTVNGLVNSNGKSEFTFDIEVKDSSLSKLNTKLSIVNYAVAYDCPKIKSSEGVGKKDSVYLEFNKTKYKLAKTVNKSEVKAGEEIEYTLILKNIGDTDIKNVILYDIFPSQHLTPIGNSALKLVDKNTLKFKRKFLPAGDLFKVTVKMKVKDSVASGTKIVNILKSGSQTVEMKDTVKTIVTVVKNSVDSNILGKETVYGPTLNSDTLNIQRPQRLVQTGVETPLIPLGISMILTGIWLYRRKVMA